MNTSEIKVRSFTNVVIDGHGYHVWQNRTQQSIVGGSTTHIMDSPPSLYYHLHIQLSNIRITKFLLIYERKFIKA